MISYQKFKNFKSQNFLMNITFLSLLSNQINKNMHKICIKSSKITKTLKQNQKDQTIKKPKIESTIKMSRKKHLYSKVFEGYNFHIGIDRDCEHQKVWTDKIEQTKHVQQMKQIDKIFQGIVRERIFGTIISERSRLSNDQFLKLDRANRTVNNSFRNSKLSSRVKIDVGLSPNSSNGNFHSVEGSRMGVHSGRKKTLQPLNLTSYNNKSLSSKNKFTSIEQYGRMELSKKLTVKDHSIQQKLDQKSSNISEGERSPSISINLNMTKFPSSEKSPFLTKSKNETRSLHQSNKGHQNKKQSKKQSAVTPRQMNLDNNDNFQLFFKNLSHTPNIFLYDIKLSKQAVFCRTRDKLNPRLLEYFFQFFGFPTIMSYRQYKKGIEKAFNSPINIIYFFTFRVLDESGNGFLTISDLFRFLQKYPQTAYIQHQIFMIREKITEIGLELMKLDEEKKHVKPSLEEILIVNHKLKADEVSELLKQSIKQQINKGGQVKLTCYSQSILSLQHDVTVRLKNYELENQKNESQAMNAKNNEKDNLIVNQDGLRFHQFCELFHGHRPKIFCLLVNVLTGMNNQDYE